MRVAALGGGDEKHLRRLCGMGHSIYDGKKRDCNSDFPWMEQKQVKDKCSGTERGEHSGRERGSMSCGRTVEVNGRFIIALGFVCLRCFEWLTLYYY